MSSTQKALNFIGTFFAFIILIIVLGALFPQYFGVAADIITKNLEALIVIVVLAIVIYILAERGR
jgi:hypothetical protein